MKAFLDSDFLLQSPSAVRLYHDYVAGLPVIDYHCHINPAEIAADKRYADMTEVWLAGDHYKWRLMRSCGVPEQFITGDADPYEKFLAYARCLPRAYGNPLYHWSHLELQRYFGCDQPLSEESAPAIWSACNQQLATLRVREIIRNSNVTHICTTDDPLDDLRWHRAIAEDSSFETVVLPAWRPDAVLRITQDGFPAYIERLSTCCGAPISDFPSLKQALLLRMDHFAAHGCCASDHGIERFSHAPVSDEAADAIFCKRLAGEALTNAEADAYQYTLLHFLAMEYARRGWVMEIHYGAQRNNNSTYFNRLGADIGFDAISAEINISGLRHLFDSLYSNAALPKTILFSLNPADNAMLNTLCGCFQRENSAGWVQQGSAWWFNDTRDGMFDQLRTMASLAPIGNFVGMVTDSRSFLSYTRHEYFRRILCNLLGGWVDNGEIPADYKALGKLAGDICYNNAKTFFNLK